MGCPGEMAHMLTSVEHIKTCPTHIVKLLFGIRIAVGRANICFLAMSIGFQKLLLQLFFEAFTAQLIDVVHRATP